jgi:hypothetical protein
LSLANNGEAKDMARNILPLSHYDAQKVLMPWPAGGRKIVEAVRIIVFAPNFPQRAVEPEIVVGGKVAQQTSITRDQRSIRGYFLQMPPNGAAIHIRYADSQEGVLRERFSREKVRPLSKECG